ncbi:thioesterase II family protein [Clostridium beijerinckii]|uniref:Surfactin synthase thioesterase subunit n=1 Tax=Clostridium beijerinckii TaxID=1520 RepID=A0A9Q5GJN6_CLOBE|nr:thioesterase domain-containing protein [Clostridium beijerinckii]AQS04672.1 linear gramicidin dehydrogenase LgrE [Clostridium beijerinckii]MBA2886879.1 surfactin synthase thioesterase subunit [Clostridium beijerinckii]MBA2901896.1 surfactin synthase thioesterase subunit [Clostridium beijerinckii]MBA2911594.1 surfactin synthase thioesterase subunit [Clostridium beijerinckii]MBA9015770.1 surfactin synthase thioesterase subunit [Clostridium beijerinckii]
MILFCLPYAGGSEVIYYKWKKYLSSLILLDTIELKGRGKRFNEGFYENLDEAVEDIFKNIKTKIVDNEYAIYGHSMGSLLAYELYYKIFNENLRIPKQIFFSGYKAPNINRKEKHIHLLPDEAFINKVIDLGGTPKELVGNKEFLQLFTPILRNDFKMLENYVYKYRKDKIQCDISVLNGKEDHITQDEILEWKNHCDKAFKVYNFVGNHFFINTNIESITNIINKTLLK